MSKKIKYLNCPKSLIIVNILNGLMLENEKMALFMKKYSKDTVQVT